MKLSISAFKLLKELVIEKKIVRGRKFTEKEILKKLKYNGSVALNRISPQRYEIELLKEENIFTFLKSIGYVKIETLKDMDDYIENILEKNVSRDKI